MSLLETRAWQLLSIPIAAAAVVGALLLIQGSDDEPATESAPPPTAETTTPSPSSEARFVTEQGFSLAIPTGWERVRPQGGAAFAAVASDGTADATLWVERDPDLSFSEFEQRSLAQLKELTGNSRVIERVSAPTVEGTIVTLQADAPADQGSSAPYTVTLRASGPHRYYLATSVQPEASTEARDGAELIHNSFIPEPRDGAPESEAPSTTEPGGATIVPGGAPDQQGGATTPPQASTAPQTEASE